MDATDGGIEAATLAFITAVRTRPPAGLDAIERCDEWAAVKSAIEHAVSAEVRPDLYASEGLNDWLLLRASGLERAAMKPGIEPGRLAAQFAFLCTRPAPSPQDWVLLDASMPPGLSVPLGEYTLVTCTGEQLAGLHPLPCLAEADLEAGPLPPGPLAGAAFLRRELERPLVSGLRLTWTFDTLIELETWKPLLALALWSPGITRAQAAYEIEQGRFIDAAGGRPELITEIYADGSDEYLCHLRVGITLGEGEIPSFTAFTAAILERVERVMAGLSDANRRAKPTGRARLARRLQAAASHLLRASHRTYGPAGHYGVAGYETNEVLLHLVIAMEALLADERDQLDLSRKVEYRAATLFADDDERITVGRLVKSAYGARSKYVHGDEVDADDDLDAVRAAARQILLRWLILAAGGSDTRPVPDGQAVPSMLDRAMLSDQARRETILFPLQEFFAATPTADLIAPPPAA